MKKLYSLILVLIVGLYSCKTDEIDTDSDGNYLQFTIAEVDTVEISFLMMGGPASYDYPLVVRHIGMPSATETKAFTIKVVDSLTNIKTGMYELPNFSFQPWSKLDTFYVNLTNYAELETEYAYLCLELQSNDYFTAGDRDYRRIFLKVHNNVSKPSWWDTNTQKYFLGTYSDARYRALIRALKDRLGEADFSNTSLANKRTWALECKAWLKDHPEVTDADGSTIVLPVIE